MGVPLIFDNAITIAHGSLSQTFIIRNPDIWSLIPNRYAPRPWLTQVSAPSLSVPAYNRQSHSLVHQPCQADRCIELRDAANELIRLFLPIMRLFRHPTAAIHLFGSVFPLAGLVRCYSSLCGDSDPQVRNARLALPVEHTAEFCFFLSLSFRPQVVAQFMQAHLSRVMRVWWIPHLQVYSNN